MTNHPCGIRTVVFFKFWGAKVMKNSEIAKNGDEKAT